MRAEEANQLYNIFLDRLRQSYDATKIKGKYLYLKESWGFNLLCPVSPWHCMIDGKFGAYMQVHIENDGPVTLELESPQQKVSEECVDK